MNPNFIIDSFTEPITALPDTPQLPASELKRRFQAPSDELLNAHNALAACVSGITDATYPDTVTEYMLSETVRDKINAKAEQTAVNGLQNKLETIQTSLVQKCEMIAGSFTPLDKEKTDVISLGFQPAAIIFFPRCPWIEEAKTFFGVALPGLPSWLCAITADGFEILPSASKTNANATPFRYIAFKPVG